VPTTHGSQLSTSAFALPTWLRSKTIRETNHARAGDADSEHGLLIYLHGRFSGKLRPAVLHLSLLSGAPLRTRLLHRFPSVIAFARKARQPVGSMSSLNAGLGSDCTSDGRAF